MDKSRQNGMRHQNFLYHAAIPRLQELGTGLAPLMGNLFSLERRMKAADTDHRRMKKLFNQGYNR